MHYVGFVDPDDMNVVSGRRKFSSLVGYSGSKLAQVQPNAINSIQYFSFSSFVLDLRS